MGTDRNRLGFWLLIAPLAVWLLAFIVLPHVGMFLVSLQSESLI